MDSHWLSSVFSSLWPDPESSPPGGEGITGLGFQEMILTGVLYWECQTQISRGSPELILECVGSWSKCLVTLVHLNLPVVQGGAKGVSVFS